MPVGKAVVVRNCVVGGGELLLAPVVAVGNEPIVSLLVRIGPDYFRHGRLYFLQGFFCRFLSEHLEKVGPANSFLLAVSKGPFQKLNAFGQEVAPFENVRDRDGFDSFEQFILISGFPGRVPEDHLVEDDAQRPDIAFGGVLDPL